VENKKQNSTQISALAFYLHMHGVNGGVSGQEGVEVGPAGGQGCLGGHLIVSLNSYRHFKQSSKHGLACNDDA
jgi:hypothetical protein